MFLSKSYQTAILSHNLCLLTLWESFENTHWPNPRTCSRFCCLSSKEGALSTTTRLNVMNRACSHDIIVASLVFPKNEVKTMSMSETRLNGFSYHGNV